MSKEIATTEIENEFSAQLPAHIQAAMDKQNGQGRGSEEVDADDLTIPRIQIIQALSPQKKKTDASYIDGAEEGDAFNTATSELFKSGMYIVPVLFRKEYLIWATTRSNDGNGFRGSFPTELEAQTHRMGLSGEDGNPADFEVVDTHQQFCLVVDPKTKTAQEVVISMAKSQIKVSKRFNTMIRLAGGDRFNCAYKFDVVDDKSAKGEFYNWGFKKAGYCPAWAYEQAEAMYDAVKSGEKTISNDEPKVEKEIPAQGADEDFPDEM